MHNALRDDYCVHGQSDDPPVRDALRRLIDQAIDDGRAAYIFVNNRFEGDAPATIEALLD